MNRPCGRRGFEHRWGLQGPGDRDLRHPPIRKVNRAGHRHRLESGWHLNGCEIRVLSLPPLRRVNWVSAQRGLENRWYGQPYGDQDLGSPPLAPETVFRHIATAEVARPERDFGDGAEDLIECLSDPRCKARRLHHKCREEKCICDGAEFRIDGLLKIKSVLVMALTLNGLVVCRYT